MRHIHVGKQVVGRFVIHIEFPLEAAVPKPELHTKVEFICFLPCQIRVAQPLQFSSCPVHIIVVCQEFIERIGTVGALLGSSLSIRSFQTEHIGKKTFHEMLIMQIPADTGTPERRIFLFASERGTSVHTG